HSAKGGEWRVVPLIQASAGNIPPDIAPGSAPGVEGEPRPLYVALPRAPGTLRVPHPRRYPPPPARPAPPPPHTTPHAPLIRPARAPSPRPAPGPRPPPQAGQAQRGEAALPARLPQEAEPHGQALRVASTGAAQGGADVVLVGDEVGHPLLPHPAGEGGGKRL